MSLLRRQGPMLLGSIVAIIAIIEFFFVIPAVQTMGTYINQTGTVLLSFMVGFALINVVRNNIRKVITKAYRWPYSVVLLIALATTVITGLIPPIGTDTTFNWIYGTIYANLDLGTSSLLAFFMCSIAFRAFRVRSTEAIIMLFFFLVQLLTNAPVGPAVLPFLSNIGYWNSKTISMAAFRVMSLGGALGTIAIGVRTILGVERGYLGLEEEAE